MTVALLLVVAFMFVQDSVEAGKTVAVARNRGLIAGGLDAADDVASRVGTVITAGIVGAHGWTAEAYLALALSAGTSFVATGLATTWANRLLG